MKSNYKHIYFIGIGGIGMSGLAEYFLRNGVNVSGSDITETHITKHLQKLGAKVFIGHNSSNVTEDYDAVVYTSAVNESNSEFRKANQLSLKMMKRAQILGEIVNEKFLIAVAGTHGKTTTTAMIGKLLVDAGLDPLIFVGGNVILFAGGASRMGNGKYAVVEADEYDKSFLTLKPDICVLTNLDTDHLDIYKNLDSIKKTFSEFCGLIKEDGKIIYYGDDRNLTGVLDGFKNYKLSYGFEDLNLLKLSNYHINNSKINFTIVNSSKIYTDVSLNLLGKHNALNSAACFGVAKIIGVDFNTYKRSISGFQTVDRRLQLKYDNGIKIYDDYAHHPVEIRSSLIALKEIYKGKLITVFQPHLFSRTKDFYRDFAESLSLSDEIILLDIYPAREKPIEGITSKLIFDELSKKGIKSVYVRDIKSLYKHLFERMSEVECIVFQGAGDVTDFCDGFINQLKVTKN